MTEESHFFLIGGELCLDFVNAANWANMEQPIRFLNNYGDLIRWAQEANVLAKEEAERLLREARKHEEAASAVTAQASLLQDTIYRIFAARTTDQTPRARDIESLNSALSEALPHQRIASKSGSFEWTWAKPGEHLGYVLWPVVRSAAELLTSDRRGRVKRCGGCNWLFLDTSKNGTRRWCTMSICGNRAKARRHYHRAHKTHRKGK